MGCVVNSPHRKEAESEDGVSKPLAAVMDSGERYVVYRGSMTLHIYEIVDDGGSRSTKKVDTILKFTFLFTFKIGDTKN